MPKRKGNYKPPTPQGLANLKPAQKGEVRNPEGINGRRPYTAAYEALSTALFPEIFRKFKNGQLKKTLLAQGFPDAEIPEIYPAGLTWAEANAIERHVNALLQGSLGDAIEVRESTEGRATQRIEFSKRNDRVKDYLEAFRLERQRANANKPTTSTS
jgi:hypothetical protein